VTRSAEGDVVRGTPGRPDIDLLTSYATAGCLRSSCRTTVHNNSLNNRRIQPMYCHRVDSTRLTDVTWYDRDGDGLYSTHPSVHSTVWALTPYK